MAAEDQTVIAELNITCRDERVRTLYVKFENEDQLYAQNDFGFDAFHDQLHTALAARYPGENCVIVGMPEIMHSFKLAEGGKVMTRRYGTNGKLDYPTEINLDVTVN